MEKEEKFSQELDSMEEIDFLFHGLALDENVEIPEGFRFGLEIFLGKAEANLEIGEEGRKSLRESKYTEKHPNRRMGLVEMWGEDRVGKYEEWSEIESKDCPRFTYESKKEKRMVAIDGSKGRGLRNFLADLSSLVVREMSEEDFIKRTQGRVRKGRDYFLMEKAKERSGKESKEYKMAKEQFKKVKGEAKDEVGVVAMVPWCEETDYSYVDIVWEYLRNGDWPGEEV